MNTPELSKHIAFIAEAHGPLDSKTPEKSIRSWSFCYYS